MPCVYHNYDLNRQTSAYGVRCLVRKVYMHMFEIVWCEKLGGYVALNTTFVTER